MKRYVFASILILLVTTGLGFWMQSVGIVDPNVGPASLAVSMNLTSSLWPVVYPLGGLVILTLNLVFKWSAIVSLWGEKSIGKAGVITAFGLMFGPLLALLMQSFVGLHSLNLIGPQGMMLGIAILQTVFFLTFGNYVAAARHDVGGGFKTRWTKQSDIVWKKTQRFLGHGVTLASVMALLSLFFAQPKAVIYAHVVAILSMKVIATIYSYVIWRNEHTSNAYDHL